MSINRPRAIPAVRHLPAVLAACLCLAAPASAGDGFTWFTNAPDISLGTTGSWQDIDCSANVPADATGVIVQLYNTSGGADYRGMVRGKEDTRDYMAGGTDGEIRNKTHRFQVVKLDSALKIQGYIDNTSVDFRLMGYTTGIDPVYFTNPPDKTPGTTGSWTPVDVSANVDADADGVILLVYNASSSDKTYSIKETGSSYANTSLGLRGNQNTMFAVGLDAGKTFQSWIEDSNVKIYLVAQTKGSLVHYVDDVAFADPPLNSWSTIDADTYSVPAAANGLFLLTEVASRTRCAVRHGDSTDDFGNTEYVDNTTLIQQAMGLNAANLWSAFYKDTGPSGFIAAYTTYKSLQINYRSIGTNAATLYSTGNASITAGTTTVTFAGGASLPTNVGQGDELVVGGETLYILTRDSATQATVQQAAAATHATAAYTIKRAYNTLAAWEAARQGDLVSDDRREIGVCYNDGTFTAPLTIEGSTTDADHYMKVTVAPVARHDGTAGTGVLVDATDGWKTVSIRDEYSQVEWLEITNPAAGDWGVELNSNGCDYATLSHLIIRDVDAQGIWAIQRPGITIRNTMILNGNSWGIQVTNGATVTIENCTIYNNAGPGVEAYNTETISVKNTIAVGNGGAFGDFKVSAGTTISYFGNNMYNSVTGFDPNSYQGGNQPPPADLEDLFVSITPGSEDLHLEPLGNLAVDKGLDLSSSFTEDIDGQTRGWPWDIGADWHPVITFQRSIGTNSATLYSTGNASVSVGSSTVTFAGGAVLPSNIGAGDALYIGVETLWILSRDSDTQVTTQIPAVINHTSEAYSISRAYNTIQAWEADRDGDLVAGNRIEVGVCYNDGPFVLTSPISLVNSTTDIDHYMKLTVADGQRHNGTAGTGVVIDGNGGVGSNAFDVNNPYTHIDGFEIKNITDATYHAISFFTSGANDSLGTLATDIIFHNLDRYGVWFANTAGSTMRNCIAYDVGKPALAANGSIAYVENCTFDNTGIGYGLTSYTPAMMYVKNTISVGATNVDMNLALGSVGYFGNNMYGSYSGFNPADHEGGNQTPPSDLDDLFVSITPGSEDYHLEDEGHLAIDTGLDLSAEFAADIDGETRFAPWDIGADWNPLTINYRSIGTDTGVLYSVGTASVALSSSTVTFGAGADLPTNIGPGDELIVNTETFYILSRDSSTQVTVQMPAATPHTNEGYTIKRVYNTLQAWEDDRGGDLVTEDRREIGVCYNDGWFTNRLVISGSTVDAGHYMHLTVAAGQRHDGVRNAGAGIDGGGGFGNLDAITVEDEYTRIEYLEIKDIFDSGDGVFFDDSPAANNGLVNGIFVHGFWQNNNAGVRTATPNTTIRNSIFTGGTSSGITVMTGCTMATIENCTIYGSPLSGKGVSDQAGTTVSIKNTISVNHPAGDDFVIWSGLAYFGNNMFGSVTGFDPDVQDGGNQLPPSDFNRLFVTPDQDFHLEPQGHRAGNTGLDLSPAFIDDVEGVTRVDAWDIGADEGVSGTEELDPKVIRWTEVKP